MGSALIDQLVTLINGAPITAPLHIDINGTVVEFPVPTIEFPEIGTMKSVATFPSGPPGVADLVSHATAAAANNMSGPVPAFGELSPPLNDFAKMSIDQLWVRFSSNGWYPIAVGIELAYNGTPSSFQHTSIDDLTLTVQVVMPADADLFGVTAWASAKLDLPGHQTIDVTIDSGGEVTLVIDEGHPVPLERILDLFKVGVPALKFPRLQPTPSSLRPTPTHSQPALREPTVRYQVGSNEFSISAGFDDVAVSVLNCSLSLDRLFVDVGPTSAANVLVHGAIGPVMFTGFLDTSGDVQIKGHLLALRAADLVGAALPDHAVSQAWDKVELAAGELTLSRAMGGVETIEFSTVCTPAAALTEAQVKFLKHLKIDVGAGSFATTFLLQSEPKLAQLEVELLTPTPPANSNPRQQPTRHHRPVVPDNRRRHSRHRRSHCPTVLGLPAREGHARRRRHR